MKKEILRYCKRNEIKLDKLERSLIKAEGVELRYYFINGIKHCGIGHNCESKQLTKAQDCTLNLCCRDLKFNLVLDILDADINEAKKQLNFVFSDFGKFTEDQQNALTEMVFQMGIGSFAGKRGFKNTIGFIKEGFWNSAYGEAHDSKWYRKHKRRANRVLKGFLK